MPTLWQRPLTWADEVKASTKTGEWHYIDLTLQDKQDDMNRRCAKQDCVTARILLFSQQLAKKGTASKWSDLDAIRFLIHFVGDVHQPLHAISDADLGGNCERLDPPVDTARNLHALWDGGMLNEIEKDDAVLATHLQSYLDQLGPRIQKKWAKGDERDWAWESH
ncbi:MAG: S1/P1 nuclease [Bryobacteraceae bacterium]